MRDDRPVLDNRDEGPAVLVAVVEIWACLVVVFHGVRERQVANSVLNHDTGGRKGSFVPRALDSRNVKRSSVVPSVMVTVVIHVPRVERIGCPVILSCGIIHPENSVAVFPTIRDAVTV